MPDAKGPSAALLADAEGIVWRFAADTPRWVDPQAEGMDCAAESACPDCGNDLDTLCPLLALAPMLALIAVAQPSGSAGSVAVAGGDE